MFAGSSRMWQALFRERWDPRVKINSLRTGMQRSGGSCEIEKTGEKRIRLDQTAGLNVGQNAIRECQGGQDGKNCVEARWQIKKV